MADTKPVATQPDSVPDIVREAVECWQNGYNRERENIQNAYDDLEFFAAQDLAQWDREALEIRRSEGRPTLQENRLPTFVSQVTNDIRQGRPAINVVPVDSEADPKVAEKIGGLIRYIENRTDGQAAYFSGADSCVTCGIGHWRVKTEYADSSTFEVELAVAPIEDQVGVVWDPDSILQTREDARYCIVPFDISRKAFEKRWPDAKVGSFQSDYVVPDGWYSDDYVRIAEYWKKEPIKRTLALMPDGAVIDLTEAGPEELAAVKATPDVRIEKRDGHKVVRYLVSAMDVLEGPQDWPGRFIPIVPVIGREIRIGRKVVRKGIVRDAKDPQKRYNYMISAHTEMQALQPKAPFIGTEKNFKTHAALWQTANSKAHPFLAYTPDKDNGGGPPARSQPPVASSAITEGLGLAAEGLKAVIGIYDAQLGNRSNETSGRAIMARERQGDTGTYHFIDAFNRALWHTGRILTDLIPHIYDTQRTIRILGEDGKLDTIEINKAATTDAADAITYYDVTKGAYDVVLKSGPSYSTRREEMREGMQTLLQTLGPDKAPLIADLYVESQDWPMAKQIAERFEGVLPPDIRAKRMQERGEKPPPPPEPDPIALAAMQADLTLKEAQARKAMADAEKAEAEAVKTSTEAALATIGIDPNALAMQMQRLERMMGEIGGMLAAPPPQPMAPPMSEPPPMGPEGMMMADGPPIDPMMMELPQEPPPGGFFVGEEEGQQPAF